MKEQGKWDNYVAFTEVNGGLVAVNARQVCIVKESKGHNKCTIHFAEKYVVVEGTLDAILPNLARASR